MRIFPFSFSNNGEKNEVVSLLTGLGARQVTGREESWLSGKDETPKASQPEGSLPLLHSVPLTKERGTGWERV